MRNRGSLYFECIVGCWAAKIIDPLARAVIVGNPTVNQKRPPLVEEQQAEHVGMTMSDGMRRVVVETLGDRSGVKEQPIGSLPLSRAGNSIARLREDVS